MLQNEAASQIAFRFAANEDDTTPSSTCGMIQETEFATKVIKTQLIRNFAAITLSIHI